MILGCNLDFFPEDVGILSFDSCGNEDVFIYFAVDSKRDRSARLVAASFCLAMCGGRLPHFLKPQRFLGRWMTPTSLEGLARL